MFTLSCMHSGMKGRMAYIIFITYLSASMQVNSSNFSETGMEFPCVANMQQKFWVYSFLPQESLFSAMLTIFLYEGAGTSSLYSMSSNSQIVSIV